MFSAAHNTRTCTLGPQKCVVHQSWRPNLGIHSLPLPAQVVEGHGKDGVRVIVHQDAPHITAGVLGDLLQNLGPIRAADSGQTRGVRPQAGLQHYSLLQQWKGAMYWV